MNFFELTVLINIFCGKCQRTSSRNLLYVEKNRARLVVVGCQQCRHPILIIRIFPEPEFTYIGDHPLTTVKMDNFSVKERTF